MTTDPAALRAQSPELSAEERAESIEDAFIRGTFTGGEGRAAALAHIRAAVESERARAETAEKARDCYLAQRDAANEQMRRLMDEHEAAKDSAEEAEKLAARLEKALRGEIWNAVNRRRQNLAAIGLPIHPAATQMLDETEVFVQAAINRALAGLAAPPPPSAEQQETLSGAPAALHLEAVAQIADEVQAEQEAIWRRHGGAAGSPPWIDKIPMDEWQRQSWRYAGSGGADAAEEIARRIRALAQWNAGAMPPPPRPCPHHGYAAYAGSGCAFCLGNAADRPPLAQTSTSSALDGASLDEHDRRTMEAWRSYFLELCDALFPESIGRPHLLGWKHVIKRAHELVTGERARSAPPALSVEQNMAPSARPRVNGLALNILNLARRARAHFLWRDRLYSDAEMDFAAEVTALLDESTKAIVACAVEGERARSAPPALSAAAAASAEKQEGRPSGLILPNDEKHGAWCIFDGPQWGCDFCCEPEGRVIEALRSEARICSACVSLAGDLEPRERASSEAPSSTEKQEEPSPNRSPNPKEEPCKPQS